MREHFSFIIIKLYCTTLDFDASTPMQKRQYANLSACLPGLGWESIRAKRPNSNKFEILEAEGYRKSKYHKKKVYFIWEQRALWYNTLSDQ